jgi:iron complex transport system ATP-binding protein
VTHDLTLAAAYSDRVGVLDRGQSGADATPAEVLTAESIRSVFGVETEVRPAREGRPWVMYGD